MKKLNNLLLITLWAITTELTKLERRNEVLCWQYREPQNTSTQHSYSLWHISNFFPEQNISRLATKSFFFGKTFSIVSLFLVLAASIVRLDVAQKKLLLRKVLWKKTQHSKMMIRHSGSDRTSNCKTVKFDFNNIPGQIIFNKLFSKLGLHLPHLLTIQYHNKKFRQQIFFEKKPQLAPRFKPMTIWLFARALPSLKGLTSLWLIIFPYFVDADI